MINKKLVERANYEVLMMHTLAEMLDLQMAEAQNACRNAGIDLNYANTAKHIEQRRVMQSMIKVAKQYQSMVNLNGEEMNDAVQEIAKYLRAIVLLIIDKSRPNSDFLRVYNLIDARWKSKRGMNLDIARKNAFLLVEKELNEKTQK